MSKKDDYNFARTTDWKEKTESLSFWVGELTGSVHDAFIGDSLTINRDIFLTCIIAINKEINHMKGYAIAYGISEKDNVEHEVKITEYDKLISICKNEIKDKEAKEKPKKLKYVCTACVGTKCIKKTIGVLPTNCKYPQANWKLKEVK